MNENKYTYKHPCGLQFNYMEMREPNQCDEGEIIVIVLWLPNCRETPMMIVDWSFADVPDACLIELCDRWVARQSTAMIETLLEVQDIAN